jgi:hypothetical protein
MTLILGMSKQDGIYMSVDYRVTNERTGKVIDDKAPKLLSMTFPPDQTGPHALFGYTGVAVLKDGTRTGDWLRETLRGESEYFDDALSHLHQRMQRDFAKLKQPLIVCVLATAHDGSRYFGGISNLERGPHGAVELRQDFGYEMQKLDGPFWFASGSGAAQIQAETAHSELLTSQQEVWPRRTHDHLKLLATINRRVAAVEASVSPHCHVSFINGDDRSHPMSHVFVEKGEEVPFEMPSILFGIDLSIMAKRTMASFERMREGKTAETDIDPDEINRSLRRRP